MDARNTRFASKVARLVFLGAAALLLAGCDVKLINRTPAQFSENPSGIYTFALEVRARSVVNEESIEPSIVIGGSVYPMQPSDLGENVWEYDFSMPAGVRNGAYYFLVPYETVSGGRTKIDEAYTGKFTFSVVGRYSISLDTNRAPVGARVSVLGRGFTQSDTVFVGSTAAQTIFESSNSLAFTVPPLQAGETYPVTVGMDPTSGLAVGTLRIDEGKLGVNVSAINIATGRRTLLVFTIPSNAPPDGLPLNVETDVPNSIIMPEVVVPGGEQSVSVFVEGGVAGRGSLFVSAPGFGEITIPVSVGQ